MSDDKRYELLEKKVEYLTRKLELANSRITFIMKQQRFWPGKSHRNKNKGPLV